MSGIIEKYRSVIEKFSPKLQRDFLDVMSRWGLVPEFNSYIENCLEKLKDYYDYADRLKDNKHEFFSTEYLYKIFHLLQDLKQKIAGVNGALLAHIRNSRIAVIEKLPLEYKNPLDNILQNSALKYDVCKNVYPIIDELIDLPATSENQSARKGLVDKLSQYIASQIKPEEKPENKKVDKQIQTHKKSVPLPRLFCVTGKPRKVLAKLNQHVSFAPVLVVQGKPLVRTNRY